MFLTLEDFRSVCDDFEMEHLTANTDNRLTAEAAALEQVSSYLRHRYDTAAAFAMTATQRNPMLVQAVVNITLWLMVHRLPQSMGYERREWLYKESIAWLRDVQNGKAAPSLPTYTDEQGADARNPIRFGSMKPSRYDY